MSIYFPNCKFCILVSVSEQRQKHLAYLQNYLPNLIIKFSVLASLLFQNVFIICPNKILSLPSLNLGSNLHFPTKFFLQYPCQYMLS